MRDGEVVIEEVWKRFRRFDVIEKPRLMHRLVRNAYRGEWWWALRDINLALEPGASLGVMGRNGCGKSTLMKLIAGHIYPYAGSISVGGHIAAITEMTAGTNGDLDGRENISLIGSLVGRTPREIAAAFDDIVSFSGIGHALDRPFKFYSSGMKARLAFAATTAWPSDVLIIDEALAVGDTEFGERAESRIRQRHREGATFLFVSHDLTSIRTLCDQAIFLVDGEVRSTGPTEEVISAYEGTLEVSLRMHVDEVLDIVSVSGRGEAVDRTDADGPGQTTIVSLEVELDSIRSCGLTMSLGLARAGHLVVRSTGCVEVPEGRSTTECRFSPLAVFGGPYWVWIGIADADGRIIVPWQRATSVMIEGETPGPEPGPPPRPIPVRTDGAWTVDAPRG